MSNDTPGELDDCCLEEARSSLRKHRDVATCDECEALLLAYENEQDYKKTLDEFGKRGVKHCTGTVGKLMVVSKLRG